MFDLVKILLLCSAVWTVIYQIALLTRIPSRGAFIIFVFFLIPLFYLYRRVAQNPEPAAAEKNTYSRLFTAVVIGMALASGIFAITVPHWDIDDLEFFHRALIQLDHPGRPFSLHDTVHNLP